MLAVVCLKWGSLFPADYVNVLYGALKQNIGEPFRFVCLTDDAAGLRPGIEARPIPDMGLEPKRWAHGCWPKLSVFKPGLIPEATQMLYLDLDVMVVGSLDPLLARAREIGGLHILREFNHGLWAFAPDAWRPDRGVQGSMFTWKPEEHHYIYNDFMADKEAAFRQAKHDQIYLTQVCRNRHYLPMPWTISFRRDCVWRWPLNLVFRPSKPRPSARVVAFHGQPRPLNVVRDGAERWGTKTKFGFGPVAWVRDYWQRALSA